MMKGLDANSGILDAMRLVSDEIRNLDLVAVSLPGSTALVFFANVKGEPVPVEVRVRARGPAYAEPEYLDDELRNWKPPQETGRVTTASMRSLALSEVTSALLQTRAQIGEARRTIPNFEAIQAGLTGAAFGFRNSRDFAAAMERLRAASVYASAVLEGNRAPVQAVAEELECSIQRARDLVAGARRVDPPYLTRDLPGMPSGQLTERARELMSAVSEAARMRHPARLRSKEQA